MEPKRSEGVRLEAGGSSQLDLGRSVRVNREDVDRVHCLVLDRDRVERGGGMAAMSGEDGVDGECGGQCEYCREAAGM